MVIVFGLALRLEGATELSGRFTDWSVSSSVKVAVARKNMIRMNITSNREEMLMTLSSEDSSRSILMAFSGWELKRVGSLSGRHGRLG
jgi:hypothetical protein